MFLACLALLHINPAMQTSLVSACDCNFTVQLIVASTYASSPDCHKARGQAACVIPRGFPLEPALGLALTGDKRVTEITWSVNYPKSAFSPGSTGYVIQEDVDLLKKAGFNCHTISPSPVTLTPGPKPNPKSNAALIALICVGACCVVVLVAGLILVSKRQNKLGQDLLLSTQDSQYTESDPVVYKA